MCSEAPPPRPHLATWQAGFQHQGSSPGEEGRLSYKRPAGQGKSKERNAGLGTGLLRTPQDTPLWRQRDGVEGLRPAGEAAARRRGQAGQALLYTLPLPRPHYNTTCKC